ncbi:MAG: glycoside hydrolase 43 family protein [Planctomycetales bacterium]|nr:glycoside hydrolase 43 family protein [Planctomycetales bacterium]
MRRSATAASQQTRIASSCDTWDPCFDDRCYRNPIIASDYSDPDVIRHGDDFYLTSSSFNCTPGLPILHSRDLVHWKLINHGVRNLPNASFNQVRHGCGIWAPALRYHDGRFWIFFPMPDEGIFVITAEHPAGQWSEPHLVAAGRGLIDPCPLWDDDGAAYLVHAYAYSRSGKRHRLQVRPMAADGSQLLGAGKTVFEQPDRHPIIEGPKFLKRNGYYYILAPAGGVATGWQVALRSRNVYGPYEDRIVLEQGETPINGPHQGGLVDTPQGQWWFIHFQDAGPYGRISHLQPARWENDWPLIGEGHNGQDVGRPVAVHPKPWVASPGPAVSIQTSDDFEEPNLGPQWQWNANHSSHWYSLSANPGSLRLFAREAPGDNLANAPHFLGQKFPHLSFTAETAVELPAYAEGVRAGLCVLGTSYAAVLVSRRCDGLFVEHVSCSDYAVEGAATVNAAIKVDSARIRLRLEVDEAARCMFSVSVDGSTYDSFGPAFDATPGAWIGTRVGLICLGAGDHADFSGFRVSPLRSPSSE